MDYPTYKQHTETEFSQIQEWRKDFEREFASKGTGHGFSIGQFGGYESQFVQHIWQGHVMGRRSQTTRMGQKYAADQS